MLDKINHSRRHFLGATAMTLVGARFGLLGTVAAPSACAARGLRVEGELPSLDAATQWINSDPLTVNALRGKVVLIDFCTYTCINWLRTLPYIRAWSKKYKDDGLVVIGIHTPEFVFEKTIDNVRQAVKKLNLDFPIAVDNEYAIWNAFDNAYWPALYFVDARGRIRHHHFGEGAYQESERVIQQLLSEARGRDLARELVVVDGRGAEASADWASLRSPENYLGYMRTENFASPSGASVDEPGEYSPPTKLRLNHWALSGNWTIEKRGILLNVANGRIACRFRARDLNLVMGTSIRGAPMQFRVLIDGRPPGDAHGTDVDRDGVGTLSEPRLYQLIRQPRPIIDRKFEIEFLDPGAQAFAFTFG